MRLINLLVLIAGLLFLALATQASEMRLRMHASYEAAHCDLDHDGGKAYAGYVFHTATGAIVHSWWNKRELGDGQRAAKSVSGDTITVKIRVRTPYHTYVTAANKSCWGGH